MGGVVCGGQCSEEQGEEHLSQPLLVADDVPRQVVLELDVDGDVLVDGVHLDDLDGGVQDIVQVQHALLEFELARLDLRDVEDVVDEVHQVLRAHHRVLAELLRARRQLELHRELQHAEHAVERRAHLVRHRRKEVALRVV